MENRIDIAALLTVSGTTAILFSILAWLLRNWLIERLKASIKSEYDERIEKIKADLKIQAESQLSSMKSELDRQAEKLRIASTSFSEVQKATIPKKIEAVDTLWRGIIKSRDAFPAIVSFTDILTDEEMQKFYTDPKLKEYSNEMHLVSEFDYFKAGFDETQIMRPHLGEYIWALYATYRAIKGRSIYLLKKGENDPKFNAWHLDENIRNMIASAFGKEKLTEFEQINISRYQWISLQFDTLIFRAIETLLTGKSFSDAALRQAHEMEKQILNTSQQDSN